MGFEPIVKNARPLISLQEQLINIREDGNLLAEFQQKPLHKQWMGLTNEYHDLVRAANTRLLPFGFMCLCEISFSAMTAFKTKCQNKLNTEL